MTDDEYDKAEICSTCGGRFVLVWTGRRYVRIVTNGLMIYDEHDANTCKRDDCPQV